MRACGSVNEGQGSLRERSPAVSRWLDAPQLLAASTMADAAAKKAAKRADARARMQKVYEDAAGRDLKARDALATAAAEEQHSSQPQSNAHGPEVPATAASEEPAYDEFEASGGSDEEAEETPARDAPGDELPTRDSAAVAAPVAVAPPPAPEAAASGGESPHGQSSGLRRRRSTAIFDKLADEGKRWSERRKTLTAVELAVRAAVAIGHAPGLEKDKAPPPLPSRSKRRANGHVKSSAARRAAKAAAARRKGQDVFNHLYGDARAAESRHADLVRRKDQESGLTFRPTLVSAGDPHTVQTSVVVSRTESGSRASKSVDHEAVYARLAAHADRHVKARRARLEEQAAAKAAEEAKQNHFRHLEEAQKRKQQEAAAKRASLSKEEREAAVQSAAERLYKAADKQQRKAEEAELAAMRQFTFRPDTRKRQGSTARRDGGLSVLRRSPQGERGVGQEKRVNAPARLYADALRRQDKAKALLQQKIDSEEQPTFSPERVSKMPAAVRNRAPNVVDRLYKKGRQQVEAARLAKHFVGEEECTFKPKINPRKQGGAGTRKQVFDRLYKDKAQLQAAEARRAEASRAREMADCTFTPEVKSTSASKKEHKRFHRSLGGSSLRRRASFGDADDVAEATREAAEAALEGQSGAAGESGSAANSGASSVFDVFDRLYGEFKHRREVQKKQRARRIREELAEATFRPQLHTTFRSRGGRGLSKRRSFNFVVKGDTDPFERLYANAILHAARREEEAEVGQLRGCTFHPEIRRLEVPDGVAVSGEERMHAMYERGRVKQAARAESREGSERQADLDECTFSPELPARATAGTVSAAPDIPVAMTRGGGGGNIRVSRLSAHRRRHRDGMAKRRVRSVSPAASPSLSARRGAAPAKRTRARRGRVRKASSTAGSSDTTSVRSTSPALSQAPPAPGAVPRTSPVKLARPSGLARPTGQVDAKASVGASEIGPVETPVSGGTVEAAVGALLDAAGGSGLADKAAAAAADTEPAQGSPGGAGAAAAAADADSPGGGAPHAPQHERLEPTPASGAERISV